MGEDVANSTVNFVIARVAARFLTLLHRVLGGLGSAVRRPGVVRAGNFGA
jgi:hypothetical protein